MSEYITLTIDDIPNQEKIITFKKAQQKITKYKNNGKSVIYTSGVFDVIHTGHVWYLQAAKTYADYLFVGLERDKSVTKLRGKHRPVNDIDERLEVIAALSSVDFTFELEEVIEDYFLADSIFEKRYKKLSPNYVAMPPDTKTDEKQKRQIQAAGAKVVVIDTPAILI